MKKRLSVLFSVIMILVIMLPAFYAMAFVRTGSGEAELLQEGSFAQMTEEPASIAALDGETQLSVEDAIYEALLNADSQISLGSYRIPRDDIGFLYAKVINDNADLFYVSSSYSYNYYQTSGSIANVYPQYAMTKEEIADAKAEFNRGVAQALSVVDDSMTEVQKAIVLHDYICSEALYPTLTVVNNQYVDDYPIYHSAYGFFHNRTVVCAGFTLTYSYLLHQLGIDAEYVSSNPMQHAWNRVKLDGNWYNVDLTWDNHDRAQGYNTYGSVKHRFMFKSDSYFTGENGNYHYGGGTYTDTSANSTLYDDAYWNDVIGKIYVISGNTYYLKLGSNDFTSNLIKRTPDGNTSSLASFNAYTAYTFTSTVTDESGTVHRIPYVDNLLRLAYLDNRFYVMTGMGVYSVLPNGRKYTVTTNLEDYCHGFDVNSDGNLFCQPFNSPADKYVLDKETYFREHMTAKAGDGNYNNYPDINLDGHVNAKDYAYIIK